VKELLGAPLRSFLSYLALMMEILKSPRETIVSRCGNEQKKLKSAFSFFVVTLAIGVILRMPLLGQEKEFARNSASLLVFRVVAVLIFAGVIQWLFSVCKGQGSYRQTLCASFYISSPTYLLLVMVHMIGAGILSSQDLGLAEVWNAGQTHTAGILKALQEKDTFAHVVYLAMIAFRLAASALWLFICWDVYQEIHRVSHWSVAGTYGATILLWCIYWLVATIAMREFDFDLI
jgi:hypothetical protein